MPRTMSFVALPFILGCPCKFASLPGTNHTEEIALSAVSVFLLDASKASFQPVVYQMIAALPYQHTPLLNSDDSSTSNPTRGFQEPLADQSLRY